MTSILSEKMKKELEASMEEMKNSNIEYKTKIESGKFILQDDKVIFVEDNIEEN